MNTITDEELIAKYNDADAIYALNRRKVLNGFQKAVDFAVMAFTPLAGFFEDADALSDMASYYLVRRSGEEIILKIEDDAITETVITGKAKKKKKNIFIYDGNQFAITKELMTDKKIFTLNI